MSTVNSSFEQVSITNGSLFLNKDIQNQPLAIFSGDSDAGTSIVNTSLILRDKEADPLLARSRIQFFNRDAPVWDIECRGAELKFGKNNVDQFKLDEFGNARFFNNVTVDGDLFADDVAYDETLVNILRVEDRIEHNGNATNKITFETDKMTIDASGTSIVLDDAAMADKIVITGQTKFINNINDVPDIYLQNHIHHSGDTNTRIGFPNNDEIALRTNGVDRVFVGTTGNVGVGTITPAYPLDVNGSAKVTSIRDTANSVGTAGQVLSSTGTALQWLSFSLGSAVLRETQPAGTNSGVTWPNPASNSLQKRQFNVVETNNLAVTVSGTPNWTFTIPTAGTYYFDAVAFYTSGDYVSNTTISTRLLLNNNTLGLGTVILGDSSRIFITSTAGINNWNHYTHLRGQYTITGTTVFTLDQILTNAFAVCRGGFNANMLGYTEVYATMEITKLS